MLAFLFRVGVARRWCGMGRPPRTRREFPAGTRRTPKSAARYSIAAWPAGVELSEGYAPVSELYDAEREGALGGPNFGARTGGHSVSIVRNSEGTEEGRGF